MSNEAWKTVGLYGGVFAIDLPERFLDISEFRVVPDHQEVYADVDTDQSIVIEINKRSAVADEESVAYFWRDLMSVQDAEEPTVHKTGVYGPADVPGVDPAAVTFAGWADGTAKIGKSHDSALNDIRVFVAAFRIPSVNSDIMITLNVPKAFAEGSRVAGRPVQSPEAADAMIQRVVSSFTIKSLAIFNK